MAISIARLYYGATPCVFCNNHASNLAPCQEFVAAANGLQKIQISGCDHVMHIICLQINELPVVCGAEGTCLQQINNPNILYGRVILEQQVDPSILQAFKIAAGYLLARWGL